MQSWEHDMLERSKSYRQLSESEEGRVLHSLDGKTGIKLWNKKKQKEKGHFRRVQVLWNRWSLQRETSLGKKRVSRCYDVSSEWLLLLNSSPKLGLMWKITSSSRKGMRHYQGTLTCLDMHLGNQSQIQIWNSEFRKVKINEAEPAKWKQIV